MSCFHHRHLHVFSGKHSSSSSPSSPTTTLNSTKLKTLIKAVVFCRLAGALAGVKSILTHVLKDFHAAMHLMHHLHVVIIKKTTDKVISNSNNSNGNNNNNYKKLFLGSFRLHYNWCSSNVVPVGPTPPPSFVVTKDVYSESEPGLSGYLEWLEEKSGAPEVEELSGGATGAATMDGGDIDRIADMFIADCHERFRLEKVESDRRFQEMLARSI